jgi:hypothetical protein
MPGASYLIAWPHLSATACALALAISGTRFWEQSKGGARAGLSRRGSLLALVASATWAVMLAGLFWQLPDALGLAAGTPMAILLALLACWNVPIVAQWSRIRPRGILAVALAATIVLLVIGFAQNRFDRQQPLQASLFYGVDADRHDAIWATRRAVVHHPWFQAHFATNAVVRALPELSLRGGAFTTAPAPLIPMVAPYAEAISVTPSPSRSGFRRWTLRLRSARGAPSLSLRPVERDDSLRLVSVNGHGTLGAANIPFRGLVLRAARAEGDEIVIDFPFHSRPAFQVMDWISGLSAELGAALTVRPPDLTTGPEFDLYNWSTVVSRESRPASPN